MTSARGIGGQVHVFGVRHLSPGAAWHLRAYLDQVQPTAVLIEGPSDATSLIKHLVNPKTRPPVAMLAFTSELPMRTAMWPLAVYSPEYEAMRWAYTNDADCAFIDLPSDVMLALERHPLHERPAATAPSDGAVPEATTGTPPTAAPTQAHPAQPSLYVQIAELAGETNYEMYWERRFEHNQQPDTYRSALHRLSAEMRALSEGEEQVDQPREYAYNVLRERYMTAQIAEAIAQGHEANRIVVVCGAYHAQPLQEASAGDVMTEQEIAHLPRRDAKLTLMPYSYYRLSAMSGYGAGNAAPLYYETMWKLMNRGESDRLAHHYLSQVAQSLRTQGTHRSTAEVIEAVRLAESLAALHGGSSPTLGDLHDAATTLFGHGERELVLTHLLRNDVGTAIGELADGVSQTPIQDDLNRQLRLLKLEKYRSAVASDLQLDLRENRRVKTEAAAFLDLRRSELLHRLQWLGIGFARKQRSAQTGASWAEHWIMQWSPEVEIEVVESTLLGETIEAAAALRLTQHLEKAATVAEAAELIVRACECALLAQMESARRTLQQLVVDAQDVPQLAAAASQLSLLGSYGDLRQLNLDILQPLLSQLYLRACLFLVDACNCNDEASGAMITALHELNQLVQTHYERLDATLWEQQLRELAARDDRNPRLSGYACALLLERGVLSAADCAEEVSRRLSPGIPADLGAGWFEGLSMRNRYGLLSRLSLWEQLNDYIESLDDHEFRRALVFLRRAFSDFNAQEKAMVAEMLGELWGVDAQGASEVLTGELKEEETQMLDDLNDFDFGDL